MLTPFIILELITILSGLLLLRKGRPGSLYLILVAIILATANENFIILHSKQWWNISRNIFYNAFSLIDISLWSIVGYCNACSSNINFRKLMLSAKTEAEISEKERKFIPYVGTDLTYKQIAAIMGVTERTIDGYRESLFAKLQVQSRQRLAIEIARRGWVEL